MGYKNFDVAIYCPVGDLNRFGDTSKLEQGWRFVEKHLMINKVYLETYRGNSTIERERMLKIKEFFEGRGVKTSGGITTTAGNGGIGFESFCYTSEIHRSRLKSVVEFTAELFDEIILDDFYFTNCKCESCVKAKGDRSWSEFRTELMKEVSENLVIQPARQVNPSVNIIIKYPNWYDHYQETGYNLQDGPVQFDMVYTGTETRDPQNTQQHLPRYLSYFLMRYLENVKPGKNGGGWFDPFDCLYNLGSYAEQAYLTVFGKAREVTLFCLSALLHDGGSVFVPLAGHVFDKLDLFMGSLGNPIGVAAYKPYHSAGEDYLHNYIGMLGIPLEPVPEFPDESKTVFLTESAAKDADIVCKMKDKLLQGGNVVITSGLLKALQNKGFDELANLKVTGRKAQIGRYAHQMHWCAFKDYYNGSRKVTIPQIDFATNDTWQVIVGMGEENNFPVLLNVVYGKGNLYVLTIPDDFGDLYHYPPEVLKVLRETIAGDLPVVLDTAAKVGLFVYDNDTFIVESFVEHHQSVIITSGKPDVKLVNLVSGQELEGMNVKGKTEFRVSVPPATYQAYTIRSKSKFKN
jgi:hypothetical protein